MPSSHEKRLRERLEQIKADAVELAKDTASRKGANLAEEAAGLALELADQLSKEK